MRVDERDEMMLPTNSAATLASAVLVIACGCPALGGLSGSLGSGGGHTPSRAGAPLAGSAGTIAAGGNQAPERNAVAAAKGPFADAKMFTNTGPNGSYTVFRPDVSMGQDGFRQPVAAWGSGISTTPDQYTQTLTQIATHGFVIVACNDTQAERPCMSAGLNWLSTQDASFAMRGNLDGAAIDSSDRVNVKATVALHGIPPRVTGAFERLHTPLLLFTSTGDTFVSAEGHVTPNFEKALVQTFYATPADAGADHVCVVDSAAQRMEVTPPVRHGGVLFAEPQGDV